MTKYVQTTEELLGHLQDQIAFIEQSAISFDSGFEDEAKRLSVAVRILVHDTSSSKSLLNSLNKKSIKFYDSATPYEPKNKPPYNSLTMMRLSSGGASYIAPLDGGPPSRSRTRKIAFHTWWSGVFVIRDKYGKTFTRKDLILNTANKDGGAHIDPELDESYAKLSRFNSLGWKVFRHEIEDDFSNSPVLPSIRQIAHEVIKTLGDGVVDLFPDNHLILEIIKTYDEHCLKVAVPSAGVLFDGASAILDKSKPSTIP